MLRLAKGDLTSVLINPRWPQTHIIIDEQALIHLNTAQSFLPDNLKLIITRGYQPENAFLNFLRQAGAGLFWLLYRTRHSEIRNIFGHNGHGTDGTHVDISIECEGRRLGMLPFGVFTPIWLLKRIEQRHMSILEGTKAALAKAGFSIHSNPVEALQIHCDLQWE